MQTGQRSYEDSTLTVTLNEAAGLVDYDGAVSGPQRRAARFTAEEVHFIGFTLSRIDLSISRTTDLISRTTIDKGKCRLEQPNERAF